MGFPVQVEQSEKDVETFLSHILDQVKRNRLISGKFDKSEKVVEFVQPDDLGEKLGLDIQQQPVSRKVLEDICDNVVRYSVKTFHPAFFNQLYRGADEYAIAGSWLSEALNTNSYTYEVAPVFVVVERSIIKYFMEKFGFKDGDGIFAPGGSISNMYGMVLARQKMFPDLKRVGVYNKGPLVAFTSEESHYSIVKGANWLGIGTDNVVKVKTDENGRMLPEELNNSIVEAKSAGKIPFFVNATSGSTVMGAYDPLEAISNICRKHEIWMHVDACWGGAVVLSKKLCHKLNGADKADSIAWNPHKMLGAPLQTSLFLTSHPGLLHEANSASARYLFQQDKFYDVSYDTGDKSIQCGRKVDGFKLWFMCKARGEEYLEMVIDNAFEQSIILDKLVRKKEGFRPAFNFEGSSCTNVCFHYIPQSMRGKTEDDEWWQKLSKIPPIIKERMIKKGSLMVGYQPLKHKNKGNFFRMAIPGLPLPTNEDMEFVLDEIERCGKDL